MITELLKMSACEVVDALNEVKLQVQIYYRI